MSRTTYLQMASSDELAALAQNPTSLTDFDKPHDASLALTVSQAIAYFWLGSAKPSAAEHGPGAGAFVGFESVMNPGVSSGAFYLVPPQRTREVLAALSEADLSSLHDVVQYGDLAALVHEENIDDLEPFIKDDDVADMVVEELEALAGFFRRAAAEGQGVVIYTT